LTTLSPQFFWYFLALPLVWILYIIGHIRGLRSLRLLGYERKTDLVHQYMVRSLLKLIILTLFLIFALLSLVDFKWGVSSISSDEKKLDGAIVLDISNSMLAFDVNGSRLERTKDAISLLFDDLGNTRFSFTLFKGEGAVIIPLTEDTISLHNLIDSVNPGMISFPGSNLEKALEKALSTLPDNQERHRAVFLFTDGENLDGNPLAIARKMRNDNIGLYIYGVGDSNNGSSIILPSGEPLRDEWGNTVITKQNKNLLEEMARISGGEYIDLSDIYILSELGQNIEKAYGIMETRGVRFEENYRYRLFLGAALVFLLLHKLLEKRKWKI
jgi:Ca-activated chloride channel family protein